MALLPFSFAPLGAQEAQLFLETQPAGAQVTLGGRKLAQTTPLRLSGLKPGPLTLEIRRGGYVSQTLILQIQPGPQEKVVPLVRSHGVLAFPELPKTKQPGKPSPGALNFLFPPGLYSLKMENGQSYLEAYTPPPGPRGSWGLTTLGLGTAGALSLLWDLNHPPAGELPVSGGTLGLGALAFTALVWFLQTPEDPPAPSQNWLTEPLRPEASVIQSLMDRALVHLSGGRLANAEELFVEALEADPWAFQVPEILFQLSRIHRVQGRTDLARSELQVLVSHYPRLGLWDRSVKALSDLEAAAGRTQEALAALDLLVYQDPLFTPAQTEVWKQALREVKP